jgi:subtilisin family serine protease
VTAARLALDAAPFAGRTGAGMRVAVVDSGVAEGHPHVGRVAGGIWLTADGDTPDYQDRIGHGTAVAAAIRERAPEAELLAVRVFGTRLATTADLLARAIEWSARAGAQLINLSLGTDNAAHEGRLAEAVEVAAACGALVVAAAPDGGRRWLPGALPGVTGVVADAALPRDVVELRHTPLGAVLACSPLPRPIDGVPPERNLSGVSFAVAAATGFAALLLEGDALRPPGVTVHALLARQTATG